MGGRLDAVNVVDPTVAVVVSIGLDHQEFLGTTLESIAREKAGIFRPGAPAVLGSRGMPKVLETIAQRRRRAAQARGHRVRSIRARGDLGATVARAGICPICRRPRSGARRSIANAAAAIAALEELAPALRVPAAAVARGLGGGASGGALPDRRTGPHGPDPSGSWTWPTIRMRREVLARNLRALPGSGRTLAVCGMLGRQGCCCRRGRARAAASMPGGSSPPKAPAARSAAAARGAHRAGSTPRPGQRPRSVAGGCAAAQRPPRPAIASWCSARSTPWGRRSIGWSRAGCLARIHREYTAAAQ